MRKKSLALTTIFSLIYQVVVVICGIILPKLYMKYFGSELNGLVTSITQFLGFITLLEAGVGNVVQSSLYRPLAQKDDAEISKIIISSNRFFRKIALILAVYVAGLMVFYPFFVSNQYDWVFTATLILIISISSFAQYFFGISYQMLLNADQKGYVRLVLQIVTLILNTVVCGILMSLGFSIHIVKLSTAAIFILRPLGMNLYVKRHFNLDLSLKLEGEPIQQKWNGLAQHIANVVLINTDVTVLTLFSNLINVSIYSVYHNVVYGIQNLVTAFTSGLQALLGDMYAKKERELLVSTFERFEWLIHVLIEIAFGCALVLIIPFVKVYTADITDANYINIPFAVLITLAQASYCLRLPYNIMVMAAGHYKQTQASAIIEAIINVVVSVSFVFRFGIIGVAIGTVAAMTYRSTYLAWYLSHNILNRNLFYYLKHIAVDVLVFALIYTICGVFPADISTYFEWIMLAIKYALISILIIAVVNILFYFRECKSYVSGAVNKREGKK
jgi:O-antigen/teichoic acid export membrane protein